MGTTYHIRCALPKIVPVWFLKQRITAKLSDLDHTFSTYRDDSELMKINYSLDTDWISISNTLETVLNESKFVYGITQGYWDPTIGPLMKLWHLYHFSKEDIPLPSQHEIEYALESVGFDQVKLKENAILKTNPSVFIDLSSIAKGYGVDRIAFLLDFFRASSYLVEIGGEIRTKGVKADGSMYKIGINTPSVDADPSDVFKRVTVKDCAVATSGNYRRYNLNDGKVLSHIINPKTGYPIENNIVSVTVIAPTCSLADALATAIMVMETKHALELLDELDNVEGFIIESENGLLNTFQTKGMQTYL